jgi:hypothetical protein
MCIPRSARRAAGSRSTGEPSRASATSRAAAFGRRPEYSLRSSSCTAPRIPSSTERFASRSFIPKKPSNAAMATGACHPQNSKLYQPFRTYRERRKPAQLFSRSTKGNSGGRRAGGAEKVNSLATLLIFERLADLENLDHRGCKRGIHRVYSIRNGTRHGVNAPRAGRIFAQ